MLAGDISTNARAAARWTFLPDVDSHVLRQVQGQAIR
jgi:hypothetical protein